MMRIFLRYLQPILLVVFALMTLSGCPGGNRTPVRVQRRALRADVNIVDQHGEKVSPHEFWSRLGRSQVVYVGESHDVEEHHLIQYEILRELSTRVSRVALGMEMFQIPFQAPLDEWVAGRLDEQNLWRETEFRDRWGFDPELYILPLEFSRANQVPVLALNAPSEWTRAVAKSGVDGVPKEIRSLFPKLDFSDAEHRRLVLPSLHELAKAGAKHGHAMGEKSIENYYQAQVLWDSTMARSIREAFASKSFDMMIVLAGKMHVARGAGIPKRVGASRYEIVMPVTSDELEKELELAKEDRGATLYWVYEALER